MILCKRNQMQCYNFFQQFRHDYRLVLRLILTITHRNAFHWYAARRLHWKWKVSSCNNKLGSFGRHTGGFYANCYGIHRYVHFKFLRMHTALELCVYECFMSFYKIFPVYFAFYISYISYSAAVTYNSFFDRFISCSSGCFLITFCIFGSSSFALCLCADETMVVVCFKSVL